MVACLARIIQACTINFPLMLWASILGNRAEVIGRRCLLLKALGYVRRSLFFVSPRLFSQEAYFSRLSFRGRAARVEFEAGHTEARTYQS
jgi:hypothetical protein